MPEITVKLSIDDARECIDALDLVLDGYRNRVAKMRKPSVIYDDLRKRIDTVYQTKRRIELMMPFEATETTSK